MISLSVSLSAKCVQLDLHKLNLYWMHFHFNQLQCDRHFNFGAAIGPFENLWKAVYLFLRKMNLRSYINKIWYIISGHPWPICGLQGSEWCHVKRGKKLFFHLARRELREQMEHLGNDRSLGSREIGLKHIGSSEDLRSSSLPGTASARGS